MNKLVLVIAAGLFLSGASSLLAQRAHPQDVYKILGISVEGNTLADPAAVIANAGLKVGDEILVPGDQIARAIRKLWSLKIFDDVQVSIERKMGDGVYILIAVKELPRYEKTEFEGRDAVSEDDITKKIGLIPGQVISPWELSRIKSQIEQLYEKEGYLLARVNVTEQRKDSSSNRVIVLVRIDEGKEVQVDHIMFEGNRAFDAGDLRGAMDGTSEKTWWKFWSSAKFDRKKYGEDKKLIVQFYKKNGYLDADVVSDSVAFSPDKEKVNLLLRVHEGPQYRVRHIVWDGNTVYPDTVLNERLGFAPGDVFDADRFEKNLRGNDAQSDVAALYLDNGYLRFNLDPRMTRVAGDSLDILINVSEMNQFKIGRVAIRGNTKTQDKVIRRELYTRPGDFFSRAAIMRSLRQLQTLNYFNPEKIKPDYNIIDDKTVDLAYEVEEKSSDNINASIGYSGAFGVTGAVGFTINNFSISEPLTGGAGQIMNFEAQFGEGARYQTLSAGFTEPWLFGSPTLLGVSVFNTRVNLNYTERRTGGQISVGRRFKWPDDYFRGDWIITAQDIDEINNLIYFGINGRFTQVSLTQVISRNSVDNPVFPTSGSNIALSTQMSGAPLLPGNISFIKWIFNSDWYMPMFGTSRVALYLGSQYGFVSGYQKNSVIPVSDRFYMGGTGLGYISTTPLRGYEDQSVGPLIGSTAIGGLAMTKQTAELRFAVTLTPIPIFLLGFAEGGNVFETITRANFFNLDRSAGFGARLQIPPIGLVGFDYGYGFDDVSPHDGIPDGWHFHFVFGKGF